MHRMQSEDPRKKLHRLKVKWGPTMDIASNTNIEKSTTIGIIIIIIIVLSL